LSAEAALANLRQIDHIVVLMMENRSFDHMLGYLERDGLPEVDGLNGDEWNEDDRGQRVRVFPFGAGQTAFHRPGQPFDESLDPQHGPSSVAEQLAGGNSGFVKNFIREKSPPEEWRSLPMGHYTAEHLPVYDFLARTYCVCDAWHSSIPGDTWPNRLYSIAARAADPVGRKLRIFERVARVFRGEKVLQKLEKEPIYAVEAFTRHLDDRLWRWYSYDPATLRLADRRYRDFRQLGGKNFAYVDRKAIPLTERVLKELVELRDSFLDDAVKSGEHGLRAVSWIDPNFIDHRVFESTSNDDHPPSDILAGQELVLELYHALVNTPNWENTLLVITYDEHGGFYDHVVPPPVPDGDPSPFATFGVRVPAIVVGPRVRNFVCHDFFDHTSLMKTILLRFAHDPEEAIRKMGPRVERAQHLGVALAAEPRTDLPDHGALFQRFEQWRAAARAERRAVARGQASPDPDGAGQNWEPTELQRDLIRAAAALRKEGLPPGTP
jgi:phospholipase C